MRNNHFLSVILVVFFISYAVAPFSFAATDDLSQLQKQISERREHIQNLQKQIDVLRESLQKKQLEKVSLQNQLSLINNRLDKTKLDIKQTKEQLQETQLLLEQTNLKIKEKEDLIAMEQSEIKELLRSLEHTGRQSMVQLFASGKTLSDFFTARDAYENISTKLTDALITVQELKIALDAEKAAYTKLENELTRNKAKLESKQDGLLSQSAAKAQLLLQTKESEAKFQQLVAQLKKEYAATEGEIGAIERKVRERLAHQKGKQGLPVGAVQLHWPVPSHVVTATFHDPDYPFRHIFEHPAIDIRAAQGTAVRAAGPGIVARAKNAGMGYSYIMLIHNNRISTVYGHMSRILVTEDEAVQAGDIIGYSGGRPGTAGAGPFVTGPHLHFEVRMDGIPVNPLDYLP